MFRSIPSPADQAKVIIMIYYNLYLSYDIILTTFTRLKYIYIYLLLFFVVAAAECFLVNAHLNKALEEQIWKKKSGLDLANYNMDESLSVSFVFVCVCVCSLVHNIMCVCIHHISVCVCLLVHVLHVCMCVCPVHVCVSSSCVCAF